MKKFELLRGDVLLLSEQHLGVLALDDAQRSRGGEERVDAVPLDQPEVLSRVRRPVRLALVHERRVAVDEGRVADVRVAHHPAHVRRRPPHLVLAHAVDGAHCPRQHRRVTTRRTQNTLKSISHV
jgi:hypothetical protein